MDALAAVAPGTGLREGIDRILQANMGALIVVSDGPEVLNICSGGFLLDAAFSPQRLSEAARLGFGRALVPRSAPAAPAGMWLDRATSIGEAVHHQAFRPQPVAS